MIGACCQLSRVDDWRGTRVPVATFDLGLEGVPEPVAFSRFQGNSGCLRSNSMDQEKFVMPGAAIRIVAWPEDGRNKSFPS